MDRGEQLMEALNELIHKKEALDRLTWRTVARDLNPTELRCVEYIGRRAGVNATRLAEAFSMTTGAASKLTKRLLARDLVTRYQKLENRKEVYFRLSPQGRSSSPCWRRSGPSSTAGTRPSSPTWTRGSTTPSSASPGPTATTWTAWPAAGPTPEGTPRSISLC